MIGNVLAQKELTLDGEYYVLQKIPAFKGLELQYEFGKLLQNGEEWNPKIVYDVITNSVIKGSKLIDQKVFDTIFAGKTQHLIQLFTEAVNFNFMEEDGSPLVETGTDE